MFYENDDMFNDEVVVRYNPVNSVVDVIAKVPELMSVDDFIQQGVKTADKIGLKVHGIDRNILVSKSKQVSFYFESQVSMSEIETFRSALYCLIKIIEILDNEDNYNVTTGFDRLGEEVFAKA